MSKSVSSVPVDATPPPARPAAPAARSAESKPVSVHVPADSVQLSSQAQAALPESTETSAQTAKEASGGDAQAKRLLVKQAAAKDATKSEERPPTHVVA